MQHIKLNEDILIAQGGEKICYTHPADSNKVIKIARKNNKILILEDIYMRYLKKHDKSFSHLPVYYGKINTNLGNGLVYERVLDYDNKESKSFKYYIANRLISYEIQRELIGGLGEYLKNNNILFIDNDLHNIFCKKISKDNYKLIIIDGLGAKRLGFKFWLYRNSKLFTKYKIKKQWKKLKYKYKKDIKVIKLIDDSLQKEQY